MMDAVSFNVVFIHIYPQGINFPRGRKTVPLQNPSVLGDGLRYLKLCLFKLVLPSVGRFNISYWEKSYTRECNS